MNAILNNILEKELFKKEVLEKEVFKKENNGKKQQIPYWYKSFIHLHSLFCQFISNHEMVQVSDFRNILEKDYEIIYALQN